MPGKNSLRSLKQKYYKHVIVKYGLLYFDTFINISIEAQNRENLITRRTANKL